MGWRSGGGIWRLNRQGRAGFADIVIGADVLADLPGRYLDHMTPRPIKTPLDLESVRGASVPDRQVAARQTSDRVKRRWTFDGAGKSVPEQKSSSATGLLLRMEYVPARLLAARIKTLACRVIRFDHLFLLAVQRSM